MGEGVKTVFFGPFVGEFAWELMFWHGWVKRLCRKRYASYRKIACSFPGRYPFYPDVDEFLPLPQKFLKNPISSRSYITDNWLKGFPRPNNKPSDLPEVSPLINEVIEEFKRKLPKDTKFIIPWDLRYDEDDGRFYGVSMPKNPKSDRDFIVYAIPYSNQILEELKPTDKGLKVFNKLADPNEKLIAIFPRHRIFRRPDKDWSKERYEILIHTLKQEFPELKIAILGEPGGAFFAEGDMPQGCIDLIQIDPRCRMDVQIAALKQSILAVGGLSGAIYFALATGCEALTWGETGAEKGLRNGNYTRSRLVFYPDTNPSGETIMNYIRWMLGRGEAPLKNEIRRFTLTFLYRVMPKVMKKSTRLAKIKKSIRPGF